MRLATALLTMAVCWAAARPLEATGALVDRIVAAVDEDPIFLSDIHRIIGLGLVESTSGEPAEDERQLQRRVLDGLIAQRLRFHEVERYDFGPLPLDAVDGRLREIRDQFDDRDAFLARLAEIGLTEPGLRQLLTRQLRVLTYIEERLGPRVFVDLEDIRAYYDGELTRNAALEDVELPPLEEVRDQIRELLRESRLNEEIEAWTEELRFEAEIVDHFHRPPREPPPATRRFEIRQ